ncbi:MAG: helix-turn-helix transcriptional regulator [Lentisphaeria bacterium]|nr:helix-turn-helix transcriptional regulator [Lentisphaeria bacterium]
MGFIFTENYRVAGWRSFKKLRVHLVYCGHEIVNSGYCNYGLRHNSKAPMLIWQYTLKGCGRFRLGELEYDIPPGYCFLAQVPEEHCYYIPEEQTSWEFIYVVCGGEESARLGAELRRTGSVFSIPADSSVVRTAWDIIGEARDSGLDNIYRDSLLAYDFMMKLFQLNITSRAPTVLETMVLAKARNYCATHMAEPITVSDLACAAGYSRWHFSRIFTRVYGKNPHLFIIEQKLNNALTLLKTTRNSLKTVAGLCGFEDASYFCKVFKNFFGVTPDEFRRNTSHEKN